jgi:hypothetical protein
MLLQMIDIIRPAVLLIAILLLAALAAAPIILPADQPIMM